jgi:prepilin-type N-terminal cleavage/methylation domain-containing protein
MATRAAFILLFPKNENYLKGDLLMLTKTKMLVNKVCNQDGLGLIELLIVITLLSITLTIGYGVYYYGNVTFSKGEAQQNLQQNVRQTAAFITNEIRFASEVEILSESPLSFETGWSYIYLKDDDNESVYIRNDDGDNPIPVIIADDTTYGSGALSFNGAGSNVLQFTLTASNNNQNYNIESQVQPLNIIGNIVGSNNGVAVRYRKDIPTGGGSNGGDNLPTGYFAFIDLNGNRVYNEGIDIPVLLEDLDRGTFTTVGYTSAHPGSSHLVGTGGSLVIPPSSGDLTFENKWWPVNYNLDWRACRDIVVGVNILHQKNSSEIKIQAANDVLLHEGVEINKTGSENLTIIAGDEIILSKNAKLITTAVGNGIRLTADRINLNDNSSLLANGSGGIKITAVNDISAVGTLMTTTNGGANIDIKSNNGIIDVRNATFANAAGDNLRPGEVGIVLSAANGINAEGAVMNNTNGGGTIKLESKPTGTININGARLNDNGGAIGGGVVIEGNGSLTAVNSTIISKNNNHTKINMVGNIDINHAQIPHRDLSTVITGNIEIISNNAGIEANDAFISAHGQKISMTASGDIQIIRAEIIERNNSDIEFISDGQLYVADSKLSYNNSGKNASANTHSDGPIPAEKINGCIALGTINGANYCNGNGGGGSSDPIISNLSFVSFSDNSITLTAKVEVNGLEQPLSDFIPNVYSITEKANNGLSNIHNQVTASVTSVEVSGNNIIITYSITQGPPGGTRNGMVTYQLGDNEVSINVTVNNQRKIVPATGN